MDYSRGTSHGQARMEATAVFHVRGNKGWNQITSSRDREKGVCLRHIKETALRALDYLLDKEVQG